MVDLAVARFEEQFGALLFVSEPMPFEWTEYYGGELGQNPCRRFVAVKELLGDTATLPEIKRASCRLEVTLSRRRGGRLVNIDPGILNQDQLVLASTKYRAHRIYLGQGIHGDLTLLYREGGFTPLPWTYPDYASEELLDLFTQLRGLYLSARRWLTQQEQGRQAS